jgi:hypothetical protein
VGLTSVCGLRERPRVFHRRSGDGHALVYLGPSLICVWCHLSLMLMFSTSAGANIYGQVAKPPIEHVLNLPRVEVVRSVLPEGLPYSFPLRSAVLANDRGYSFVPLRVTAQADRQTSRANR